MIQMDESLIKQYNDVQIKIQNKILEIQKLLEKERNKKSNEKR